MKAIFTCTKRTKGFTLIELSLFMGMFSIILLILLQIFTALMEKQLEVESTSAVESDRVYILSRLAYDITRADSITLPAAVGQQGDTLSLVIDGKNYTYTKTANNIILNTDLDTNTLNSFRTSVPDLRFQRIGNTGGKNAIHVSYTIESIIDTPQGRETKSIDTTIGTR